MTICNFRNDVGQDSVAHELVLKAPLGKKAGITYGMPIYLSKGVVAAQLVVPLAVFLGLA